MVVVDASAVPEFLLQTPLGSRVEARLFRDGDDLHAPHLVDVEGTQGLGRLVRLGEVSSDRASDAIADLVDLDLPDMVRRPAITQRALRPIAQTENATDQKAKFQELVAQVQ